jgi:hypothetical protein
MRRSTTYYEIPIWQLNVQWSAQVNSIEIIELHYLCHYYTLCILSMATEDLCNVDQSSNTWSVQKETDLGLELNKTCLL